MYPFETLIFEYNMSILAVIAGGLLYTAMSDILPSFKEKGGLRHKFLYLIFMLLGVLAFVASNSLTGHDDHGHEGENHTEIIDMHEEEIH